MLTVTGNMTITVYPVCDGETSCEFKKVDSSGYCIQKGEGTNWCYNRKRIFYALEAFKADNGISLFENE